jgi:hypothetical protein
MSYGWGWAERAMIHLLIAGPAIVQATSEYKIHEIAK